MWNGFRRVESRGSKTAIHKNAKIIKIKIHSLWMCSNGRDLHSTVLYLIREIYSHTFLAKIRETNVFTKKKFTKELIWRNIFGYRKFFIFHPFLAKLSWKKLTILLKKLLRSWFDEIFFNFSILCCEHQTFFFSFNQLHYSNQLAICHSFYNVVMNDANFYIWRTYSIQT